MLVKDPRLAPTQQPDVHADCDELAADICGGHAHGTREALGMSVVIQKLDHQLAVIEGLASLMRKSRIEPEHRHPHAGCIPTCAGPACLEGCAFLSPSTCTQSVAGKCRSEVVPGICMGGRYLQKLQSTTSLCVDATPADGMTMEALRGATTESLNSDAASRLPFSSCAQTYTVSSAVTRILSESASRRWSAEARPSPAKVAVWQVLTDSRSSRMASVYQVYYTMATCVVSCIHWASALRPGSDGGFFRHIAFAFAAYFALELALRFWSCPSRRIFWFRLDSIIDALTSAVELAPHIMTHMVSADIHLELFVPFVVLLRLLRRSEHFHLLASAFSAAFEALPILLCTQLLIALLHAGAVYILEPREVIPSWEEAMWYTVFTMFTVSYSNISPTTTGGKAAVSILVSLCSLYMAIPIGIVGNAFGRVWKDRERLLMLRQFQRSFVRAGFKPEDLLPILRELDRDGNKELSFDEFRELLLLMELELPGETAFRLFQSFDRSGAGTIDFRAFIVGAFPAHDLYMAVTGRRSTVS